jgi:hypothetical protein
MEMSRLPQATDFDFVDEAAEEAGVHRGHREVAGDLFDVIRTRNAAERELIVFDIYGQIADASGQPRFDFAEDFSDDHAVLRIARLAWGVPHAAIGDAVRVAKGGGKPGFIVATGDFGSEESLSSRDAASWPSNFEHVLTSLRVRRGAFRQASSLMRVRAWQCS